MPKKKNNTKVKNIILIIIIFGIIGYTIFYFSKNSSNSNMPSGELGLMSSKYGTSIENIKRSIDTFYNNIFSNLVYKSLRSFVKLPLELGRVGKEDPFAAPPSPLDDLLGESQ